MHINIAVLNKRLIKARRKGLTLKATTIVKKNTQLVADTIVTK